MDEIIALQRELAAVQKAPSAFRLSEPNVVEVVKKLAELALVDVLFTTNGKEYLTPKQLHAEVEDEILSHGGRINITELPPLLNVDLPHIERAVDALLRKGGHGGLQLVQGELMTDYYVDALAEEINTHLQGAGRVSIGDLAVQHVLSTDFVLRLIEPRLGSIIDARLSGSTIYTRGYVARHTARVRGALSALSGPASLAQIIKDHKLNETLFHEALAELASAGRLPGVVQGKQSYTPALHVYSQAASIGSFYAQNGVVELASLGRLGLRDPLAYLSAEHPDGVPLVSVYMSRDLLAAAEAEVEEACASGSAVELRDAFPCTLTDDDVHAVIDATATLSSALSSGRLVALSPSLLAPKALLDRCEAALPPLAESVAQARAQQQAKRTAGSGGAAEGGGSKGAGGGGGGGGKGKASKAARREEMLSGAVDDSDDDDDGGRKGKGKKGKGKKGGGGGGGGGVSVGGGGGGGGGGVAAAADDGGEGELLSTVEAALRSAEPGLAELAELLPRVAVHLLPRARALVDAAARKIVEAGASARRKAVQAAQEEVSRRGLHVQLCARGVETLELPPKEAEQLDKALLKSGAAELYAALLRSEALHAGMDAGRVAELAGGGPGQRKELLAPVREEARAALSALEKTLAAKTGTVSAFLDALWASESTLGEQCPRLDKKREKALLAASRTSMREQLQTESSAALVIHVATLLLVVEIHNAVIDAPGRLVPLLLEALKQKIPEPAHAALGKFQAALHATLAGDDDEAEAVLRADIERVRQIGLGKGRGPDADSAAAAEPSDA